jgi:hypothetical protein
MIGQTISRNRMIKKLGDGRGIVYKAKDTKPDRFHCARVLCNNDVLRILV